MGRRRRLTQGSYHRYGVSEPETCWGFFFFNIAPPYPPTENVHTCTHRHSPLPESWADDSSAAGTAPPSVQAEHHLHPLQLRPPRTHIYKFGTVQPHTKRDSLCPSLSFLSYLYVYWNFLSLFHTYYHSPPASVTIPPIKHDTMEAPCPSHTSPPGGQPCGNIVPHSSPSQY